MFDVIGDIHGHAGALKALLERLGYAPSRGRGLAGVAGATGAGATTGAWRHPSRTAIFLGDFVDRGPAIAETIGIVRAMVESGAARAVLGNHEMNALAYATPRVDLPDAYCRPHTERNRRLHEATLQQLSERERGEALDWFRTLPFALDLGGARVVHACWDSASLRILDDVVRREGGLTDAAVRAMHDDGDPAHDAMELVLKGPEIMLPSGVTLLDAEGHTRRVIRARWFEAPRAWTYDALVFPPSAQVPAVDIPATERRPLPAYSADAPPLFFGHYWMSTVDAPTLLAPNLACLDWSVARGGMLVAYSWNGEQSLDPSRFVWVSAGADHDGSGSARTMSS